MRNFWILTKLQLLSLFGINRIRHQKAGEEKKKGQRSLRMLALMAFALVYGSVAYSMMLAEAFAPMGQLPLLLGLMSLATSVLTLVFSMFEARSVLYGFGDYDMVMSWPVSRAAVASARGVNMYLYNLAYGLLLLLPAGVIYALRAAPPIGYYPALLLSLLLLPALPSLLGMLLGTLITVLTSRMKRSNVWNTVGQFVLMIALLCLITWLNSSMMQVNEQTAAAIGDLLGWYPIAAWVQAAASGLGLPLLWTALVSLAALAVMLLLLTAIFPAVHGLLSVKPRAKRFTMRAQAGSGRLRALYRREWRRYTASSLYVTNTAFGYVLLLAAGVAAVTARGALSGMLSDPGIRPFLTAAPLVIGMVAAMSATTGSAISMEGKQFWIVRTLPVTARELFLGKILVSMTLAVPAVALAGTLIGIGLRAEAALWPWLYITPLAAALFSAVLGLAVNLAMPRFDWTNEAEVVKQSAAMAVSMFGAMGALVLLTALAAVLRAYWTLPASTLALLIAAACIWRGLMKKGEGKLRAL
ncbi:MAG: hypothetical protein Q4C13_05615 [Clostridia bacterium]|nr:hypothetical protein [Clostridia bacterium]